MHQAAGQDMSILFPWSERYAVSHILHLYQLVVLDLRSVGKRVGNEGNVTAESVAFFIPFQIGSSCIIVKGSLLKWGWASIMKGPMLQLILTPQQGGLCTFWSWSVKIGSTVSVRWSWSFWEIMRVTLEAKITRCWVLCIWIRWKVDLKAVAGPFQWGCGYIPSVF